MLGVDIQGLRAFINDQGKKQNAIASKLGMTESQISLILQEKRKLEAGEYASICRALNVPMERFLKEKNGQEGNNEAASPEHEDVPDIMMA